MQYITFKKNTNGFFRISLQERTPKQKVGLLLNIHPSQVVGMAKAISANVLLCFKAPWLTTRTICTRVVTAT